MRKLPLLFIMLTLLLVAGASALPYFTGTPQLITYNGFTAYFRDSTYDNCYVKYGLTSTGETISGSTVSGCLGGAQSTISVLPGYAGRPLYIIPCNTVTGCNSTAEQSFALLSGSITTGAATDVNSNGFNSSVTAINGSTVWIEFGEQPGFENWKSAVYPVTDIDMTVQVIGAPLYGGEHVYFRACDETGCGAELDTTLLAVTTIPTPTFRQGITNITNSRFNIITIGTTLVQGYTQVTGATIFFAIMFMFFMIGIWMRTRSVRLIAIIGIMISPMIMYASSGLYLGLPVLAQAVSQGLLAAGLAGVALSFIRR